MEKSHTIIEIETIPPAALLVRWDDGTQARIDLAPTLRDKSYRALRDGSLFAQAQIGDWGHSVEWPGDIAIGADSLWRMTLRATGRADAAEFLEWRLRHGLSLNTAAQALGLSRRMVAYYSSGEKPIPRTVLLACKGWEVEAA